MKYLITLFLNIGLSFGAQTNDLEHWLSEELNSHQETLLAVEKEGQVADLFLNLIRVRVRTTLSVELPFVAKGKVRPEIELYYTR